MKELKMDTGDLADFFGKSTSTIRRTAIKLGLSYKNGVIRRFNKNEVELLSSALYKKTPLAIKESINNTFANVKAQPLTNEKVTFSDMITSIKALADTVNLSLKGMDNRLNNLENKFEDRKALLPAPKKSDRDNLNQIVRNKAYKETVNYSIIWNELYTEAYYRLNINLKERAKNRNMSIIDYAENENLLSELLSIAMEIFN